jgi:hypothetical protein
MRLAIFILKETGESLALNPENIIVRQLKDEIWVNSCGSSFIVEGNFNDVVREAVVAMNYIPDGYEIKEKAE